MKALNLAMVNTFKKISETRASEYDMAASVNKAILPYNIQPSHRTEEITSLSESLQMGVRTRVHLAVVLVRSRVLQSRVLLTDGHLRKRSLTNVTIVGRPFLAGLILKGID